MVGSGNGVNDFRTMTARSIPLPVFEADTPKGHYRGYRIVERNGYFYPQQNCGLWWSAVRFTGTMDEVNCSSVIFYSYCKEFNSLAEAKFAIDAHMAPKNKTTKIHYL